MKLTESQKDTLTEVINIGFSRTAASLSELTGHRVILDVPEVSVHPIHELTSALGKIAATRFASVHQVFKGPVAGDAFLLLNVEGASLLASLLSNQPVRPDMPLDESAREVLVEVGNILLNACLATFGDMLKVRVSFSVPRVELDVLDAMLQTLAVDAEELHYALVVSAKFRLRGSAVDGYLVLVLGVSSLDRLLDAINQLYEKPLGEKPTPSSPQ